MHRHAIAWLHPLPCWLWPSTCSATITCLIQPGIRMRNAESMAMTLRPLDCSEGKGLTTPVHNSTRLPLDNDSYRAKHARARLTKGLPNGDLLWVYSQPIPMNHADLTKDHGLTTRYTVIDAMNFSLRRSSEPR